MNYLEQIIHDIDYITEHLFDDYIKQIKDTPNEVIIDNNYNKKLFFLYITFCFKYHDSITIKKDFKETFILNTFHEHIVSYIHESTYINQIVKNIIDYDKKMKQELKYIRDILFQLYLKTS